MKINSFSNDECDPFSNIANIANRRNFNLNYGYIFEKQPKKNRMPIGTLRTVVAIVIIGYAGYKYIYKPIKDTIDNCRNKNSMSLTKTKLKNFTSKFNETQETQSEKEPILTGMFSWGNKDSDALVLVEGVDYNIIE